MLSQRHGLDWDEWVVPFEDSRNPIAIMLLTEDWYRTVVEWRIAFEPNQDFACSAGASSLQSMVLNNVTGTSPRLFARANLFQPLDINDVHWELSDSNGMIGQGERVLDQSWIDESIKSYSTIDTDPDIFAEESYGYGLQ